jgi:MFS family permease
MSGEELGTPDAPEIQRSSAWTPLRDRTFRTLWLVWMASNVSMWMNDVAAAWMMTSLTSSATLIAMVTTASAMPVFLLGLPSGALADIVDRRRYYMVTQFWVAINAAILYLVSVAGWLNAHLLLLLVFGNGVGLAMRWPVYAAIVPELVPRSQLSAALALNAVAVNFSRVVGPLVAGLVIASFGSQYVFALNFAIALCAAVAISRWKRASKPSVLPGERFIGAMRLGWQYVRESQRMKDALVRTSMFFLHATAMFALMPLVATRFGNGGAGVYTTLLACLGVGAIAAATQLPKARGRYNRDQLAFAGTLLQGACTAAVAFAPHEIVAGLALVFAGAGVDPRRQFRDDRGAARAPRLGTRARHGDLPDVDHGRHRVRRLHLGAGSPTTPAYPRASPSARPRCSSGSSSRTTARSKGPKTSRRRIRGRSRCR